MTLTLSIVGMVIDLVLTILGMILDLVLTIVGMILDRCRDGYSVTLTFVGMILDLVWTVVGMVIDLTQGEGGEREQLRKAIAESLRETPPGILGGHITREEQEISRYVALRNSYSR